MVKCGIHLLILLNVSLNSIAQETPIRLVGQTQGTSYHITYFDFRQRNLQSEIDSLLHLFDLSVSTYIPNSIISRINNGEDNVKVDPTFKKCFKIAKKIWRETEGAFDPTVYPLVNAWGFGPEKKPTVEREKLDSLLNFVGFEKIQLKCRKTVKSDDRVTLDFNSFAQGYSVDVISNFLIKKNIKNFLVEIGGEVYGKGKKPDGQPWSVGVEKPYESETENSLIAISKLNNLALATSGDYRKYIKINGEKYAHIIDPKTGFPIKSNILSVSVFANNCVNADAYATAFTVMGLEKSKQFLKKHPRVRAFFVYSDEKGNLKTYESQNFGELLKIEVQ